MTHRSGDAVCVSLSALRIREDYEVQDVYLDRDLTVITFFKNIGGRGYMFSLYLSTFIQYRRSICLG